APAIAFSGFLGTAVGILGTRGHFLDSPFYATVRVERSGLQTARGGGVISTQRRGGKTKRAGDCSPARRVPVASTSRPGLWKAHGTWGEVRNPKHEVRSGGGCFLSDFVLGLPFEFPAEPVAVLEQPSSGGVAGHTLGRRNIALSQS